MPTLKVDTPCGPAQIQAAIAELATYGGENFDQDDVVIERGINDTLFVRWDPAEEQTTLTKLRDRLAVEKVVLLGEVRQVLRDFLNDQIQGESEWRTMEGEIKPDLNALSAQLVRLRDEGLPNGDVRHQVSPIESVLIDAVLRLIYQLRKVVDTDEDE